ncbi:hypothetical protein NM688_g497 [Phlebia brevispora]|uniref:Uncharacterized protein n=1 Tax=Phlebia brevispora TaxID=194682 RepID=A0ACC1TDY0_9APHY|nr:hypothetical protein NM688_g497 [Phlebia brevispora]
MSQTDLQSRSFSSLRGSTPSRTPSNVSTPSKPSTPSRAPSQAHSESDTAYPPPFDMFFNLPARPQQGQVVTVWRRLIESCLPASHGFNIEFSKEEPKAYLANYELNVIKVTFLTRPVLFVLVNDPALFPLNSARADADTEMRQLMQPLLGQFDIETLHGLSVFGESGTSFRVYKIDKVRFWDHRIDRVDCDVEPCPTPPDPHIHDREPRWQWPENVGTLDGQRKLINLFNYVRSECGILESLYHK